MFVNRDNVGRGPCPCRYPAHQPALTPSCGGPTFLREPTPILADVRGTNCRNNPWDPFIQYTNQTVHNKYFLLSLNLETLTISFPVLVWVVVLNIILATSGEQIVETIHGIHSFSTQIKPCTTNILFVSIFCTLQMPFFILCIYFSPCCAFRNDIRTK